MQDESDKDKAIQDDVSPKWSRGVIGIILKIPLPKFMKSKVKFVEGKVKGEGVHVAYILKNLFEKWLCLGYVFYGVPVGIVLVYPEVMNSVGLEPLVEYFMYEVFYDEHRHLIYRAGHVFARYFFRFYTASLLVVIFLVIVDFFSLICFFKINGVVEDMKVYNMATEQEIKEGIKDIVKVVVLFFLVLMVGSFLLILTPLEIGKTSRPSKMPPPNYFGIMLLFFYWGTLLVLFKFLFFHTFQCVFLVWWPSVKKAFSKGDKE